MCLHQDRGRRMRQMDSLMPTLNEIDGDAITSPAPTPVER
jgi:hypothetical protein